MSKLYRIARCPKCYSFFIVEDHIKAALCRSCNARFRLDIRPRARKFHLPRHRWVARGDYMLMRALYTALNRASSEQQENRLTYAQAIKLAQYMGAQAPGAA